LGAAQSFTPSGDSLTRVDIAIRKFGAPEFNLTFEIREESINGPLVEIFVFQPEDVDENYDIIRYFEAWIKSFLSKIIPSCAMITPF
jgi:hypothetical protein